MSPYTGGGALPVHPPGFATNTQLYVYTANNTQAALERVENDKTFYGRHRCMFGFYKTKNKKAQYRATNSPI